MLFKSKSIDEKFNEIGFIKTKENKSGASYERENKKFNYTQVIELIYKANGTNLLQSYQEGVNKDGFNNVVGLSMYETKLALNKMHQMGWKSIR